MRLNTVPAHPNDNGLLGFERIDFITEIAGFLRSPRGVVFWVKIKHDLLAKKVF
jgi:hypothetical protein